MTKTRHSTATKPEESAAVDPFRDVLDRSAVALAVIGPDNTLSYSNPAFANLLGYSTKDLTGLSVMRIAPANETSAAFVEFQRLMAGKTQSFNQTYQCAREDGSLIWVVAQATVQQDVPEGPKGFVLQLTEIDALKRAEEDLVYREQRWSNALMASGQGVWDHDRRNDTTFHNVTWHTIRGYAPGEGTVHGPEEWMARIHPDDRDRIQNRRVKQERGEDGFDTLEYRERRQDGSYAWIFSRGRPIEWSEDGEPIRTVGTDTDITERKQIEAQLAEEKERLRVTLQSIGEGVISTDAHARINFINRIAEDMTGWTHDNAIGRPVSEVFHSFQEDDTDETEEVRAVDTCLASGEIYRPEFHSRTTNRAGVTRYVRETAAPVRDSDGAIIGAVMVIQDATLRRKMQQELAYTATHDSLTRLPNRMAFETRLAEVLESASQMRSAAVTSLCLIDLDHFKQVNDNGGHLAGDALLKDVANKLKSCCRHNDFAARMGGDEFVLILENCKAENAVEIANKFIESVSSIRFAWNDEVYRIGASIGITEITSENAALGSDAHYKRADDACYVAKEQGRNRVSIHKA